MTHEICVGLLNVYFIFKEKLHPETRESCLYQHVCYVFGGCGVSLLVSAAHLLLPCKSSILTPC